MLALVLHPQVATRDLSQDLTNLEFHSLYTIPKHASGTLALLSVYLSAQIYGYESIKSGQSSEILIGKFANESQSSSQPLIVGTKFFTVPWTNLLVGGGFRLGRRSMIDALRASLKRMDRDKIDLYQVRNIPHLATVVYQRPQGVCSLPALVRLHSAFIATASLMSLIASAALNLSHTAKGSTLKRVHAYIELLDTKTESSLILSHTRYTCAFKHDCSHVFLFAQQALSKHLQLWKAEVWKGEFSAGPCVHSFTHSLIRF